MTHESFSAPVPTEDDLVALRERVLPAVAPTVRVLRRWCAAVAASLGATEAECRDVEVAVGEAVTNAVLHAYPPPGRGAILARIATPAPGRLDVTVVDRGVGLAAPSGRRGIGRGLILMDGLADELEVRSALGAGTSVRMAFRLGA